MSVTVDDVVNLIKAKLNGRRSPAVLDARSVLGDAGLSSLQIADIVYTIEDGVGVRFDPVRAADVATIGDLVALANITSVAVPRP